MDKVVADIEAGTVEVLPMTEEEEALFAADIAVHAADWTGVKMRRNELLYACDFTQLVDASVTPTEQEAWAAYRQELRDIPQMYQTPADVVWPEPPQTLFV